MRRIHGKCSKYVLMCCSKYYHSFKGWITVKYHHMKLISKKRGHPPPKFTKKELFSWLIKNYKNEIDQLFMDWKDSNYCMDRSPSLDRLNDSIGYSFRNIQLVDWETNYKKSHIQMYIPVIQKTKNGKIVKHYKSISDSAEKTGLNRSCIGRVVSGVRKTCGGFLWERDKV